MKRGIDNSLKHGEAHSKVYQISSNRLLNTRKVKRNYEIGVAQETKSDPKRYFSSTGQKLKTKTGQLKTSAGDLMASVKDINIE